MSDGLILNKGRESPEKAARNRMKNSVEEDPVFVYNVQNILFIDREGGAV